MLPPPPYQEVPKIDGYTFSRWEGSYENVTEAVDIYAVYTPIEYSIKYMDGEDVVELSPDKYTIEDNVDLPVLEREGAQFIGWYEYYFENSSSPWWRYMEKITPGRFGDLTLHARWLEDSDALAAPIIVPDQSSPVEEGQKIKIYAKSDADIYYKLDWDNKWTGDPQTWTQYTGAIEVTEELLGNVLNDEGKFWFTAVAVLGEDVSDISSVLFTYNAKKLTLSESSISLGVKGKHTLQVTNSPAGYSDLKWKSEDPSIARVDEDGTVTGVSVGETSVSATMWNNKKDPITASCTVIVDSSTYYTVEFRDSDGTTISTQQVKEGADAVPPTNPEKKGYKFTGWDGEYTNITKDTVLTAQYEIITYKIEYVLNDGENAKGNPNTYTVETETIVLADPTRDGYIFTGWYQDSAWKEWVSTIPKGSTGDRTFYAKWIGDDNLIAPVIRPDSGILEEGQLVTIYANADADVYYTLDGTTPSEQSTKYEKPFELTKDATVRAVAVLDGDESNMTQATYDYYQMRLVLDKEELSLKIGGTYALRIERRPRHEDGQLVSVKWSVKSGRDVVEVLDGEVTALKAGTAIVTAEDRNYKDEPVTAECRVTVGTPTYTVRFLDEDGNVIKEQTVEEGKNATPPDESDIPKKPGYQYDGWSGSYENIMRNVDLTVRYKIVVYTITYELNGGENAEGNPTEYTVETETFTLNDPSKEESFFKGWYEDPAFGGEAITEIAKGSTGNRTLYAKWFTPKGLWMTDIMPQAYTGAAVKPEDFLVYDGYTVLTAGVDYTISYKNNNNAFVCDPTQETQPANAPMVVIKGKGNYAGTVSKPFTISPVDIAEKDSTEEYIVQIDDIAVAYKAGKSQKPAPVVLWGTKKLAVNKDYTLDAAALSGYTESADYPVTVTGKGNFTGTRTITFTIASSDKKPISAVKASKIPDQDYTGKAVKIPGVTLKDGGSTLKEGTDYTLEQGKYVDAGTYSVLVRGKGDYIGVRRLSFKIKGTPVKSAKVTSWNKDASYNGKKQEPEPVLAMKGSTLKKGKDYTIVSYTNNVNAGTAKVTIAGKGAYSGTASYAFKIKPASASGLNVAFKNGSSKQPYQKGGTKPELVVVFGGQTLAEGVDYSLSWKNNVAYPQKSGKDPEVVVTGKRNFTGKTSKKFSIASKKLSDIGLMTAPDVMYNTKPGKFYSTPQLYDTNGKKLTAGTDYKKELVYKSKNKDLSSTDAPAAKSVITITVTGAGAYEGTYSCTYRVLEAKTSVAKAKIKVKTKFYYTGQDIIPGKEDLDVTLDGQTLIYDTNYEVIPYPGNPKKGKAKFLIAGKGKYGGQKTVTISIASQGMKWWQW